MDAFPELHTLNQFELSVVFQVHILQCAIMILMLLSFRFAWAEL